MTYAGSLNDERVTAGSIAYQNGPEGIANQASGASTTSFTRDPSGTLVSERIGSARYYYLFDSQNTVLGFVNSSGTQVANYSYDPYGKARVATSSGSNPFGYVSGVYDTATALTEFGARYYDPALRRFTQQDPSLQERNAYAYVGCSPVNATDTSGRSASGCFAALAGAIGSGLLAGASLGVLIGTVVPGVGNIFGAITGSLIGGTVAALVFVVGAALAVLAASQVPDACK